MPGERARGPSLDDVAKTLLDALSPGNVAKGRMYADDGRVGPIDREGWRVQAEVRGTERYVVSILFSPYQRAITDCNCPAYARDVECKHVAAVAIVLERSGARAKPRDTSGFPDLFRQVHSTEGFFARLALYAGRRFDLPRGNRWYPLVDWWRYLPEGQLVLREEVRRYVPRIAKDLDALRAWTPPAPPVEESAFTELYAKLALLYVSRRDRIVLRSQLPGPVEDRGHPGFEFTWDPRTRAFETKERPTSLTLPLSLRFATTLAARTEPRFENGAFSSNEADAWDLFALRATLIALHAREADAARALAEDLARPVWDVLLEQVAGGPATSTSAAQHEWAFWLVPPGWYGGRYKLLAQSRRLKADGKPTKWKRTPFDALYGGDASALERDIARIALVAAEKQGEAWLDLGTPHAHEALRLLAMHPRVFLARAAKPAEDDPLASILAGDLEMRLERRKDDALAPRFFAGEREIDVERFAEDPERAFQFAVEESTITSAYVPPSLRSWVATAVKVGPALAFPPAAVPRLAETTRALVANGVATLPRSALGEEESYAPKPALRVEWKGEHAILEALVSVHPSAPLVPPSSGAELYTFEHEGRRVFVERDFDQERKLIEELRPQIEAPVVWDFGLGRTEDLLETLVLADWLEKNPLGLPIEVRDGRAPQAVGWTSTTRALRVSERGKWLVLDGEIHVQGKKLSIGEVLDAARLARRFIKAEEGLFVELSKEAIADLEPLAIATELAGESGDELRLHPGFVPVLGGARRAFEHVHGVDIDAHLERFTQRNEAIKVPPLDDGKLRKYQRDGVRWMLALAEWAPGCILADDMGLGKTVQTAAVLKARAAKGPQLIVAPASVSSNWIAELQRFVSSLDVRWFNDERALVPTKLGKGDVLVVSYGLLQRRHALFEGQHWATVVVDEAQYVKNTAAQRTDAVRGLSRDFTIALTGTPLENHLGELYSIVDLVFPGLLGSEQVFKERFRRPIEQGMSSDRLAMLGRLVGPFLLRRTRASVLDDLPAREEITERIALSAEESRRYLALRRVLEEQLDKKKKVTTSAQLKIAVFAGLMRLRQLACDVRLVDPTYEGESTKIVRTVELATELAAEGNRALVFSQFTQFLDRIRDALVTAGLRVGYLTGETPTTKRKEIIDAFQAGEYDVFCVSLLAGGTGLNLTAASYVIHTDPWWNPAVEEQATSRAHRIGQKDPVTVYRLVARGTIEEAVLTMHEHKRALAEAVLDAKDAPKAMSAKELMELLKFGGETDD